MRDPTRIAKFCDRLGAAWARVPDQRFGQLMMNCLGQMASEGHDPFFPEDEEMISFIEAYTEDAACGVYDGAFVNNHIENMTGGGE